MLHVDAEFARQLDPERSSVEIRASRSERRDPVAEVRAPKSGRRGPSSGAERRPLRVRVSRVVDLLQLLERDGVTNVRDIIGSASKPPVLR